MVHLFALAGILAISFSAIFVRLSGVSPVTATFFRALYALPLLLALWLPGKARDRRSRRDRAIAVASGLMLAADLALWHESIALIGAGLATVIANVQVVFVAVAAWAIDGERPTPRLVAAIAVVLGGVALTSGIGSPDAYGSNPAAGGVLGVLAGVCYAAFLLVFRAATQSQAPAVAPLLDMTAGTAIGGLACAILDPAFTLTPGWPANGWLILLAIVPQVLGWLLIATVLPRLPAVETSLLLLGQPAITVVWGVLLFSERLAPLQWAGAGVVLGGILIVIIDRPFRDVARPQPEPARHGA